MLGYALLLLGHEAHVEWIGDACPGAAGEFERALAEYVGPGADAGAGVVADMRVREVDGRGIQLTLTLTSAVGQERHELEDLGCDQLVDQAALLVAGAIDPFVYADVPGAPMRARAERVPIQQPAMRVEPIQPTEARVVAEPPVRRRAYETPGISARHDELLEPPMDQPPTRRRVGTLGASATGFVGLFPRIGGGVQLDGALGWGALRWQSAAAGYFGGRFRAGDGDVGADLWALSASTGVCGVPGNDKIELRACGLLGLGFVSARAVGTNADRRSTRPWAQAGGEVGVAIRARPQLAVVLGVGVLGALVRPSWAVQAPDATWMVPPIMGLMRLGMEIRGRRDQNRRL